MSSNEVLNEKNFPATTRCPHVDQVGRINEQDILDRKQHGCDICQFRGASRWLCITENCLFVGCGERRENHAAQHANASHHHVQMNLRTNRFWCHQCQIEALPESIIPQGPDALQRSSVAENTSQMSNHSSADKNQNKKLQNGISPRKPSVQNDEVHQVISVEYHAMATQQENQKENHDKAGNTVQVDRGDEARIVKSSSVARQLIVPAPGPQLISVSREDEEKHSSGSTCSTATGSRESGLPGENSAEDARSAQVKDVRVRQFVMPGRPYNARERPTAVVDFPVDFGNSAREEEPIGLTGLRNLGNTCYMNSALQALSNTVPLTEYLLNCNPVALAERPGQPCLAIEYRALNSEIWNERRPAFLVPYHVLSWVRMCHPSFRGFQQQDAQEFLRFFLDQLHEDLRQPVYPWECQSDVDHFPSSRGRTVRGRESTDSADENGESSSSVSRSSGVSDGHSDDGAYRTCDSGWLSDHEVSKRSCPDSTQSVTSPKRQRKALSESDSSLHVSSASVPSAASHWRPPSAAGGDSSDFSDAKQELSPSSSKRAATLPKRKALRYGSGVPRKKAVRFRSIVSDVFDGKLLSSVQCLTCNTVSETRETFQDLSIPIPGRDQVEALRNRAAAAAAVASYENNNNDTGEMQQRQRREGWWNWFVSWFSWLGSWMSSAVVTLEDCLAAFFSADDLKGDDMYSCDGCKKLRNGVRCCYLLQLPEVLCIHLKRFRHELMYSSKVSTRVSFPLEGLDLRPFLHRKSLAANSDHVYDLYAVVCHHGTVESGHYTAYCLNSQNGRWYEYDDQCVTEVDPYVVQSAPSAYIMFYRKRAEHQQVIRDETAALLQRPGSVLPKFFISQEWINRFNNIADPGPITNFDFLCPHGCIDPKKHDFLTDLYAEVPAVAWQYLYKTFGGGPVCNKLLHCIDCNQYYRRLMGRRQDELETFYRIERAYNQENMPDFFYALSMKWFRRWEAFVLNRQEEPPGQIDNGDIAAKKTEKTEFVRVKQGSNYVTVHRELWEFFYDRYGGGPEVLMTTMSSGHANRSRSQGTLAGH